MMGQHAYLARIALGRSAFEKPAIAEGKAGNHRSSRLGSRDGLDTDRSKQASPTYEQQYNDRGYATNEASSDLKRLLTHAQNDVLSTVGVCTKVRSHAHRSQFSNQPDQSSIERVRHENEVGLFISMFDVFTTGLLEQWIVSLRERLQVFRYENDLSLSTVIHMERSNRSLWAFLFAGVPSACTFELVNRGTIEGICLLASYGRKAFYDLTGYGLQAPESWLPLQFRMIQFLKLATMVASAPLEIFATLQRLSIISASHILPGPGSYMVLVQHVLLGQDYGRRQIPMKPFRLWNRFALTPLFLHLLLNSIRDPISGKFYRYFRAAMPKPTHPDQISLRGAYEDELDADVIPGLIDEQRSSAREITSVLEILAQDLQSIGRIWQVTTDKMVDISRRVGGWFTNNSAAYGIGQTDQVFNEEAETESVPPAPADLRAAMQNITEFDGAYDSTDTALTVPDIHPSIEVILDARADYNLPRESHNRDFREDTPSPESSRPRSTSVSIDAERGPILQGRSQIMESALPDISPTDPDRTLDYSNEPSQAGVAATIDGDIGGSFDHINEDFLPRDITHQDSVLNRTFRYPTPSSSDDDDDLDENPEVQPVKRRHRVTTLSAHAAEAMAQHLAWSFTDLLLLPLEALFVRSIARAFLLPNGGQSADLLPMGTWFGLGIKQGGWRSMSRYGAKMFLLWAIQLGSGFAVWELSTGIMWWTGLKWYKWNDL